MHAFSLVVCRHPVTKLWLAVEENKNRGWWLPGGFVECGDNHFNTAIKETQEEAGVDVELKGILRIENTMTATGGRQRVIFYAEPKDLQQQPKMEADGESMGAAWMSEEDLKAKSRLSPPEGLRGPELLHWSQYIEGGGTIYPLSILTTEDASVPTRAAGAAPQDL